jgi:hypothetical protein
MGAAKAVNTMMIAEPDVINGTIIKMNWRDSMRLINADALTQDILNDNTMDEDTKIYYKNMVDGMETVSGIEQKLNNGWIPITEGFPEVNKDVQVTFREYMEYSKEYRHGTCKAIYIPNHTITIEDMGWNEYEDVEEYDEQEDCYYVKCGWYEVIENCGDYSHVDINCEVTAWRPLPEPYKEATVEAQANIKEMPR